MRKRRSCTLRRVLLSGMAWAILQCLQSSPLAASDDLLLERTRGLITEQLQALENSSFQVVTTTVVTGFETPRTIETVERLYYGNSEQVRRDLLQASQEAPASPPGFGRRGGRMGPLDRMTQFLDPRTLLHGIEGLSVADGQPPAEGPKLEFEVKLELPQASARDASLWADPKSGMPVRLEFTLAGRGMFLQNAKASVDFEARPGGGLTLPSVIKLDMSMMRPGGPGGIMGPDFGGAEISFSVTSRFSDYRGNLQLTEEFFQSAATSQENPAGPRGSRNAQASEADPFQEISLLPSQARPSEGESRDNPDDVYFIQGASRDLGEQGREGNDVLREIMGMDGGMGRGGPGRGGFGGGRGMRLAGSRANRIQGSLQIGLSGSALDARPYSLTGEENPKPEYRTWNAGISVGGPLPGQDGSFFRVPGQFFFNFNTTRGRQLNSAYASVPTLLEREGDFSRTTYPSGPLKDSPVRIFDPVSGSEFQNGIIPPDLFHPTAVGLLEFFPLPNRDDPFVNYFSQQAQRNHQDQFGTRLTLPLHDRLQLSGSYNLSRSARDAFNVFPGLASRQKGLGQNFSLSANSPLRPGLIQNVRLRFNRNNNETLNPFAYQSDISRELGFADSSSSPIDFGIPSLILTNYSNLNDGNSSVTVNETVTVSDAWMIVSGRHFFRIGFDYSWVRANLLGNPNGAGSITLAGVATSQYESGHPVAGTGYDLADLLLGWAQSSEIQYGNPDHYGRSRELALFLNDNWRFNSRFTLQWGLRYDYVSPFLEKYDRIANLDIGPDFSRAETVIPGAEGSSFGTYPRSLVRDDRNNFAPRLGLAYRIRSGRSPTVLRAEYGVFYPSDSYSRFARELIAQPPFGFAVQQTAQSEAFLELENAFSPSEVLEAPNTYAVDPHFRLQAVQNWGLSIQQGLGAGLFGSLGYGGSRGTGLELLRAPNRLTDSGEVTPGAAEYLYLSPGASSTFHGLQLLLQRRMRAGFSLSGQYEFGKSLDNASTIGGRGRTVAQNDDDLASEKGLSSFDVRHRLSIRGVWELPFGRRHTWLRDSGFWTRLVSDWYTSWGFQANSGQPFTASVMGNQINNSGSRSYSSERASATGVSPTLPSEERGTAQWFYTGAFTLPEPGVFGNAGRNTIPGPGNWKLDFSLYRSIPLKEYRRLLVSLSAQNVLNHVNFVAVDTVVNSRGFGQVTAAGPMRQVRLELRFVF